MKRSLRLFTLTAGAALLSACSLLPVDNDHLRINHANGKTVVKKAPQRVITFDYSALETLALLDANIVGLPGSRDNMPKHLAKFKSNKIPTVGTMFEPDLAAVKATKPDLIVIGGRSSKYYEQLNRIAPTINMALDTKNLEKSLTERTQQFGQLFQKEAVVAKALSRFEMSKTKVRILSKNKGSALTILTTGGHIGPSMANSRFGFIYDLAGFKEAQNVESSKVDGKFTLASIAKVNPDWLFVIDRDQAIQKPNAIKASTTLKSPIVRNTTAVKKQQVVYVDSAAIYLSGGLTTYQNALDSLIKRLQK